jgi:hypothetical protein
MDYTALIMMELGMENQKDLIRESSCQVFPTNHMLINCAYSTILIGSSFLALNAATLTCAATFWAISRRAFATAESG